MLYVGVVGSYISYFKLEFTLSRVYIPKYVIPFTFPYSDIGSTFEYSSLAIYKFTASYTYILLSTFFVATPPSVIDTVALLPSAAFEFNPPTTLNPLLRYRYVLFCMFNSPILFSVYDASTFRLLASDIPTISNTELSIVKLSVLCIDLNKYGFPDVPKFLIVMLELPSASVSSPEPKMSPLKFIVLPFPSMFMCVPFFTCTCVNVFTSSSSSSSSIPVLSKCPPP